jgi:hypothetical protein
MHPHTAINVGFLFLFTVVVISSAVPEKHHDHHDGKRERDGCLTKDQAEDLRDLYISFFVKISDGGAKARESVVDDFTLYSDSSNSITPNRTFPVCPSKSSP